MYPIPETAALDLSRLIISGLEEILSGISKLLAEENFYCFVLSATESGEYINFHANSEENILRCYVSEDEMPVDELRWCFPDWGDYELIGDQSRLEKASKWLEVFFEEPETISIDESFRRQSERLTIINQAMIMAMQSLIHAGNFGAKETRDKRLFCVWGCDDESDEVLRESLQTLNTHASLSLHKSIYDFI